ncbi:hypothetical protein K438DRAFT_1763220 [Mycena galopus ATCC 62051]|nr:hypothetical protein K438DRAFT_1763220 [Mycena galopus ATCC 62051]
MSSPKRRKKIPEPGESLCNDTATTEQRHREQRRETQAKYRQYVFCWIDLFLRQTTIQTTRNPREAKAAHGKTAVRHPDQGKHPTQAHQGQRQKPGVVNGICRSKSSPLSWSTARLIQMLLWTHWTLGPTPNHNSAVAGLTSAERFALDALSELRQGPDPQEAATAAAFVDPMTEHSLSSVAAAHEEPVRMQKENIYSRRSKPLPGSITFVQAVQLKAYKLRKPTKFPEDFNVDPPLPEGPFLSSARWHVIFEWRGRLTDDFDQEWDATVRRELAEDALQRRLLHQVEYHDIA